MSKTRVFVSSTCFDLGAVREHLRERLMALGHEPLCSEYPSFPVAPDESTIDNCKKVVREHADILVLIVGGRYGSLDEATGKSVTNVEYDTALAEGVPVFVFVKRSVHSLLSVWRKNPDADLSDHVDDPSVFGFIEQIRDGGAWVFDFEKTAEIIDTLTIRLSELLRDLLGRKKGGRLAPAPGFGGESEEAQRLARDRPELWEHFLSAELLETRLSDLRRRSDQVSEGRFRRVGSALDEFEVMDWVVAKIGDLEAISEALCRQLPRLSTRSGGDQDGDPADIRARIDEFAALCEQLVEWEVEIASTHVPDEFKRLVGTLRGTTTPQLGELERIPGELRRAVAAAQAAPGGEDVPVRVGLTFDAPLNFDAFHRELKRLKRKRRWGF